MAINKRLEQIELYKHATIFLAGHGFRSGHKSRPAIVQMIEKFTGVTCEIETDEYVGNFVRSQKKITADKVRPVAVVKPYVMPLNLQLAAQKASNNPVPITLNSRVNYRQL